MMVEQSLLDSMTVQMGCAYLSDLRFLSGLQRRRLAKKLSRIPPREEDLRDWNDALEYLTDLPPEKTCSEAKSKLIEQLYGSGKRKGPF